MEAEPLARKQLSMPEVTPVPEGFQRVAEGMAAGVDSELRDYIREWRREMSKEQGVPAYIVMHDSSLEDLCRRRPSSLAELLGVSGFGERHRVAPEGSPLRIVLGSAPIDNEQYVIRRRMNDVHHELFHRGHGLKSFLLGLREQKDEKSKDTHLVSFRTPLLS